MNESIAKLLQPISTDQPCGPDLSYDPRLEQLETLLVGKAEVEIGSVKTPAEPPDWRDLQNKSIEFLGQCKHLRVAVLLGCSLLKTNGLAGFSDGLELIRSMLEQYWPAVYPLLDPEDNNDPTQRLNILSALSPRRESMGLGWLTITQYLGATPICQPKGGSAITFEQLQTAKLKGGNPKDPAAAALPDGVELRKLETAIRAADPEQVAANDEALRLVLASLNGIDHFLTETLGAGNTISFDVLQKDLEQMFSALKPYLAAGETAPSSALGAESPSNQSLATPSAAIAVSGPIRSRQDVERAIDTICEYYRQVEPSSPVPYLLRRAQKLAGMNFVQAVQELNLGSIDALRPSLGSGLDSEVSAEPASASGG